MGASENPENQRVAKNKKKQKHVWNNILYCAFGVIGTIGL